MYNSLETARLLRAVRMKRSLNRESLLQKNLRIGQEVLDEFRDKFGYPISYTYLAQLKYNGNTSRYSLYSNIENEILRSRMLIRNLRNTPYFNADYENLLRNLNVQNACNCGEQAKIAHHLFAKKNISAVECLYFITNSNPKRPVKDHAFIVIGYNNDEYLWNKPKYWGKFAVVIDPWSNIVAQAEEWNKQGSSLA